MRSGSKLDAIDWSIGYEVVFVSVTAFPAAAVDSRATPCSASFHQPYAGIPTSTFTVSPDACATVSAGLTVTPVPRSCAAAPAACASASGAVRITPVPRSCAAAPLACASVERRGQRDPGPGGAGRADRLDRVELEVRAGVDADRWPAVMPVTLATLMFVAPAAAAAASVVAVEAAVPTLWIVTTSMLAPVSTRMRWPAVMPATLATWMVVSPAFAAGRQRRGGRGGGPDRRDRHGLRRPRRIDE